MTVGVLARTYGLNCGIGVYGEHLAKRLHGILGTDAHALNVALADPVIIQYEPSLYTRTGDLIDEIESLLAQEKVLDVHTELPGLIDDLRDHFGHSLRIGVKTQSTSD